MAGRKINLATEYSPELPKRPEIFYTLQGEGRSLGKPSTFMRLSGCNLQCIWCDTPYTWNFEGTDYYHEGEKKYSREEESIKLDIGDAVNRITQEMCQRVVITGGEPLVQQNALLELITEIKVIDNDYRFEIETNGTIVPTTELYDLVEQFNVSVKLSNSGMPESKRLKENALLFFSRSKKADFKFVVADESDLEEVIALKEQYEIPSNRIYLMPEGINPEEQSETEPMVAELCKEYGFNFTPRLHIQLWGSKRGV